MSRLGFTTAVVASFALPMAATTPASAATFEATIVKVYDGDSLLVELDGEEVEVRLIGVDAPEVGECFHEEATEFVADRLEVGERVRLQTDRQQPTDHRLFAYVYDGGDMVNRDIIKEGYAQERAYGLPYKRQRQFLKLQEKAQEDELGGWEACF